jgi:tRNA (cytidine/uridine-2'-O-)-methyltransferase
MLQIALYQPDMAGNVGAILRTAACFGVSCSIIEPCGFAFSNKSLKRAGMDYAENVAIHRHVDWEAFDTARRAAGRRIVLMTVTGALPLTEATFHPDDILLMGSEGAGVPDYVHAAADVRVFIPMVAGMRSLNISVSAGIALSEALRQTGQNPATGCLETIAK